MIRPRRIIALTLLAILALCAAAFATHRAHLHHHLIQSKAALRAEGIPVTQAEFDAMYPISDDVVLLVDKACAILGNFEGEPGSVTQSVDFISTVVSARDRVSSISLQSTAYRPGFEPALELLEQACANPTVVAGVPLRDAEAYRDKIARAAKLYSYRASERRLNGDIEGSVADVIASRRLLLLFRPDSAMRKDLDAWSTLECESLLCRARLTEEQLDRIDTAWALEEGMIQYLLAASAVNTFEASHQRVIDAATRWNTMFPNGNGQQPPSTPMQRFYDFLYSPRLSTYWIHEPGDVISSAHQYLELAQLRHAPPEMWLPGVLAHRQKVPSVPRGYLRTKFFALSFFDVSPCVAAVTSSRLVTTATAIERFRLANGQLPLRMSDLTPEYLQNCPRSAWDGKQLEYVNLGGSYIVSCPTDQNVNLFVAPDHPVRLEITR